MDRLDVRRGRADLHGHRPRRHREAPVGRVPIRQRAGGQVEGHVLHGARRQGDALEAAQLLARPRQRRRRGIGDVELHDLVAGARAAVAHVDADLGGPTARQADGRRAERQVRIRERRVAEPVTERIQRRAREVPVGGPLADVVVEDRRRDLGLGAIPGRDRAPARVVVAEQHVGDRGAQLLAGVGDVDDRLHVGVGLERRHALREAGHEHDDRLRVRRGDALHHG